MHCVSLSVSLTSGGSDRCSVDTHVQHTTEILMVEVSVTELPQDGQLLVLGVRLREKRLLKGRGEKRHVERKRGEATYAAYISGIIVR